MLKVANLSSVIETALAHDGPLFEPPDDREYGERRAIIDDPFGQPVGSEPDTGRRRARAVGRDHRDSTFAILVAGCFGRGRRGGHVHGSVADRLAIGRVPVCPERSRAR
jgi:hypothetical protein